MEMRNLQKRKAQGKKVLPPAQAAAKGKVVVSKNLLGTLLAKQRVERLSAKEDASGQIEDAGFGRLLGDVPEIGMAISGGSLHDIRRKVMDQPDLEASKRRYAKWLLTHGKKKK